jgi:hypothetical protein
VDAVSWLGGRGRDPSVTAELLANSLVRANVGLLRDFGVDADVRRSEGATVIALRTSTRIGAVPLVSPVTGRPDFGLVIEPRFAWTSIGDVLSYTGFKVIPRLLPLPELPLSDRRIPSWVLSSVVLHRLQELLDRLTRRFTISSADHPAPKGSVDWAEYSGRRIPTGRALDVPCRFPDLRDDEALRSAIHFTLRQHQGSLLGQRSGGVIVLKLLTLCEQLLSRVAGTPPSRPKWTQLSAWRRLPIGSAVYREGLQAIEWTTEERGLAGLSELAGLSWQLDMENFFEAWVETIAERVAACAGARLRSGRKEQTRIALDWRPPRLGAQRSLVPDLVVERPDCTMVIDAKYKSHAEEIRISGWNRLDDVIRERHRADLLQVLAYSTLFDAPRVIACLVYPCLPETYTSLHDRGQLVSRAMVPAGGRQIELLLATAPIGTDANETIAALAHALLHPLIT